MSAVIKAGANGGAVTPFGPSARAAIIPVAPAARSATELALDDAREEIAALQAALIAAREASARLERTAREAGRREGLAAAADESALRAAQVGEALHCARAAWDDRLAAIDALAVMVARAALERMFNDHDDLADLATRGIAARITTLGADSIVAIRVSAGDFAGADALAALRDRAGADGVDIIVDTALKSGQCRIALKLGQVDCGIDALRRDVDALLADLIAAP